MRKRTIATLLLTLMLVLTLGAYGSKRSTTKKVEVAQGQNQTSRGRDV